MSNKRAVAEQGFTEEPSSVETEAAAEIPSSPEDVRGEGSASSTETGSDGLGASPDAGSEKGAEESAASGKSAERPEATRQENPQADPSPGKSGGSKTGLGERARRPGVLVPALLIVLLLVSTTYLGVQLHSANALTDARSSASDAGKQYALDLTTYDFRDLNGNFNAVTQNSTEKFGKQYKQVSDSLSSLIQQYQATSKGTLVKQGVVEADEDRVVLAMFVDQAITNTNSPQPRVDRNRMQMTLVRTGDRWLLDDLQLL